MVAIAASSYAIEMGDKECAQPGLDSARELLAGIESGVVELHRRHIDLAAMVVAAIVEVSDRERISYAKAEHAMVLVDPHHGHIACGVLLQAAVDGCAQDDRISVRTTASGLVEIVRQGAVHTDTAALSVDVAQGIARAYGGNAWVEATPSMTRWSLWLPLVRVRKHGQGHLLLVDDNAWQCQALAELLKPEGFTVDVSFSAQQALEHLASHRPDLLLVDMRLGEVGGDEVIRLARARYPGLPAIVITGYPREHAKVRAILAEAPSDYMAKPTDPDALFALVARMLSAA